MQEKYSSKADIVEKYKWRVSVAGEEIEINRKLSFKFSMIRLGIFILAFPILYFLIKTNLFIFAVSFILLTSLFLWAVVQQLKYDQLLNKASVKKEINENEINAIQHHCNLYYQGENYKVANHKYSEDLDIFGEYSLYGLINRCRTYYGNRLLRDAFLKEAKKKDIYLRQEAIKEISNDTNWSQDLAITLFSLENLHDYNVGKQIKEELEMDLSFADGVPLKWYRKILPLIWPALIALYFIFPSISQTLATFLFIGNLLLVGKYTKRISAIQGRLSKASSSLSNYSEALKVLFSKKWNSPLLIDASSTFENNSKEMPIKALAKLSRLINLLDYRLNLLVAILSNGLLLWDLIVVSQIGKWKRQHLNEIEKLFNYIGFMEAMSSLAVWAHNNPEYSYPEIHDTYLSMDGKSIEHPLISEDQNVSNHFNLRVKDRITMITGSNMSGKSTFLRTIGINMILAYSGTKVAAESMSIPIVTLVTYMRIKDALEENVSTFKAELNRIEMILTILEKEKTPFILIDEMLRGTNSKDKLNGSIGITKKILSSHAYGMIATHDIKLAEMGLDDDRICNYYFDIDYKDGDLVFDYKIKEGVCENFNASFLLGQLGIETEV